MLRYMDLYEHAAKIERRRAVGLARSLPAISGAVPCTASNIAPPSPMFPLGVSPRPPINPAHRSDRISPYRLGITSTSYWLGSCTMFKHTVSRYLSSNLISGCSSAASRQHLRKSPSLILIMLALCTAVTLCLPFSLAYLKA